MIRPSKAYTGLRLGGGARPILSKNRGQLLEVMTKKGPNFAHIVYPKLSYPSYPDLLIIVKNVLHLKSG